MFYYSLKILHIISATLMLTSIIYSYCLWKTSRHPNEAAMASEKIQIQTWLIIIPFALIQLATGFTMISVQHYDFSQWWISGSVIGFIVVIGSWLSFIYFLILSQQLSDIHSHSHHEIGMDYKIENAHKRHQFFRKIQSLMLVLCAAALFSMVFFMTNKSANLYG